MQLSSRSRLENDWARVTTSSSHRSVPSPSRTAREHMKLTSTQHGSALTERDVVARLRSRAAVADDGLEQVVALRKAQALQHSDRRRVLGHSVLRAVKAVALQCQCEHARPTLLHQSLGHHALTLAPPTAKPFGHFWAE